ncbi:MAG: hypothetical protein HeimC3_38890 [Candidatus Heimdallarchaeota archaeon LC_3]|nr:MAG: hypothetical protein HeimC3_38890 [Candidatus Heimdallarchaeota archaeon LC_3]
MEYLSLKNSFISFFKESGLKNFIFILIIGIGGQLTVLTFGIFLKFNSAEQLSIEYLFIFSFAILLITASIRHGYPIIILFAIEFLIITHEETNSLYNLHTYMYTGFTFNIGYQNAIPITDSFTLPAGGYPIGICFAWILLIYGCYNFTNFLIDGTKTYSELPLRQIPLRIFLDSMFLWQFSLLVEGVGIDLGYWIYGPKDQPKFFGAPMDTLYYYLITAFLFNSILRIGEQIYYRKKRQQINLGWFNGFSSVIFLYFWFFLLVNVIIQFEHYHWAFFIGTPSLFLFSAIFLLRFIIPKYKEMNVITG